MRLRNLETEVEETPKPLACRIFKENKAGYRHLIPTTLIDGQKYWIPSDLEWDPILSARTFHLHRVA